MTVLILYMYMQVLPHRSELTDLAGDSLARPDNLQCPRPARLCRPLSSYMSHASNIATGDRQKPTVAVFPNNLQCMIQAGSLLVPLSCALNEIRTALVPVGMRKINRFWRMFFRNTSH